MTDTPRVIGITGAAGSGKTLAGTWFLHNHKNVTKLSFARPLKRMLYELIREAIPKTWPVKPGDYTENPDLKETPIPFLQNMTSRHMMQTLGTEWGRNNLHPDFWTGIAAAKLERLLGSPYHSGKTLAAFFDDLRFPNEAAMIRDYGGVVLRIVRPGHGKPDEVQAHASERFDFEADVTLVNDGTPEDLHRQLAQLWPPTVEKKKA